MLHWNVKYLRQISKDIVWRQLHQATSGYEKERYSNNQEVNNQKEKETGNTFGYIYLYERMNVEFSIGKNPISLKTICMSCEKNAIDVVSSPRAFNYFCTRIQCLVE